MMKKLTLRERVEKAGGFKAFTEKGIKDGTMYSTTIKGTGDPRSIISKTLTYHSIIRFGGMEHLTFFKEKNIYAISSSLKKQLEKLDDKKDVKFEDLYNECAKKFALKNDKLSDKRFDNFYKKDGLFVKYFGLENSKNHLEDLQKEFRKLSKQAENEFLKLSAKEQKNEIRGFSF